MKMEPKSQTFMVKGMRRDLSKGIFDSNYAFEIKNMRITAREDNTLLSLTNEKGNLEIAIPSIDGELLGYCVLNNNVILFTKGTTDNIYKIVFDSTVTSTALYLGNLNFAITNPIETIGMYENENVQKVYFVDGRNQPRVVDINKVYSNPDLLNFSNKIAFNHTITVNKLNSGGIFPTGTIQYAFSYYNLYGLETNIFETTPMYYLSLKERGLSPEETANCAFNITFTNLDTNFDFVRIYSIIKTSIDSTPVVKRVTDLSISTLSQSFTDTGNIGDNVDPMQLYYIGGETIIAGTMAHKDNTLFLGNIKLNRLNIGTLNVAGTPLKNHVRNIVIDYTSRNLYYPEDESTIFYGYKVNNNLSSFDKKVFKAGETYRLGFIALHESGKWSEAIWVGDAENNSTPVLNTSLKQLKVGMFEVPLTTIKDTLLAAGYVRVAPVVVLPTVSDRTIIALGIVCPTVYNVLDRSKNAPFALSSWFARVPAFLSSKHDAGITSSGAPWGEILLQQDTISTPYMNYTEGGNTTYMSNILYIGYFAENHMIDLSIITFHSPEIEIGEDVSQGSLEGTNFRIVGYANFTSAESDIDLTTSTPGFNKQSSEFIRNTTSLEGGLFSSSTKRYLVSNDIWVDRGKNFPQNYLAGFVVYPWHRSGSLNDDTIPNDSTIKRTALLERKKMSHLLYGNTIYPSGPIFNSLWVAPDGITTPQIFNSDVLSTVKIPSPANSQLPSLTYYGNIDRLVMPNLVDMSSKTLNLSSGSNSGSNKSVGYPIYVGFKKTNFTSSNIELSGKLASYSNDIVDNSYNVIPTNYGTDPVHIKYKSSPHVVFALNYTSSGDLNILPCTSDEYTTKTNGHSPFWVDRNYNTICTNLEFKPLTALWVGELYRPVVTNRFGGNTDEALLANQWLVCGPPVKLNLSTVTLQYLEGDTYFARYDSLKTYPFTMEDTNSVVEIMSTYIETRVNLDTRYDRNRGLTSNLVMHPAIFNLFNPAYQLKNNYFTYRTLDYDRFNIDSFYNSITWTLEKAMAEEVDTWTTLTLANTLDLDGDKGQITSLNVYNNEIYCFQERGFSNILFNSRVQIPASDGVPIEISNGAKVGGKRYVSNTIGCFNKQSIAETPNGIYFIDNITNSIYQFNGQLIRSLSDEKGFRQWISDNNSDKLWDPVNFDNFSTSYDANNNDVYFTNKTTSLCYSELLQEFTAFMNYEKVPAMFNVGSKFIAFKNNKLWELFAGNYNFYFGVHKPYSITYIANGGGVLKDRIFNYIEFKADMHDLYNVYLPFHTFDVLEANTEYLSGTNILLDTHGNPSNLKKKFNIWRAQMPRDGANGRDRIRNPWCYVKLGRLCEDSHKLHLHNASIYYHE